ncbi:MAG: hypothetical protein Kow0042_03670 [Calditrichia bacterium]
MKQFKGLFRISITVVILGILLFSVGCEKGGPLSPIEPIKQTTQRESMRFLKLKGENSSFDRLKTSSSLVTVANGGYLSILHGDVTGMSADFMYGTSIDAPYNVYQIDPANPSNPQVVGQLAFAAAALALHPQTGKLYYLSYYPISGEYPVGVWDPETNTNTILPQSSGFRPAGKLAFDLDGNLYGVSYYFSNRLYKIDTQTGAWTYIKSYNYNMGAGGDLAITPEGVIYNIFSSSYGYLDMVDMNSSYLNTIGLVNVGYVSGLCSDYNGTLYLSQNFGEIYEISKTDGTTTYRGDTGIHNLADLAPVIAHTELTYASVSLSVLPGTISEDAELSLELETTQLSGGVSVTFQPHGTTFSQPAILNLSAHGVDFSSVDPTEIDIFYVNQETGQWEPMQRDSLLIDVNAGTLQVVNARLPHFSRYAVGDAP